MMRNDLDRDDDREPSSAPAWAGIGILIGILTIACLVINTFF